LIDRRNACLHPAGKHFTQGECQETDQTIAGCSTRRKFCSAGHGQPGNGAKSRLHSLSHGGQEARRTGLQDVAAKYKGQGDAAAKLAEKVRKGGVGVWGPIPMPPNGADKINDADLRPWSPGS